MIQVLFVSKGPGLFKVRNTGANIDNNLLGVK